MDAGHMMMILVSYGNVNISTAPTQITGTRITNSEEVEGNEVVTINPDFRECM